MSRKATNAHSGNHYRTYTFKFISQPWLSSCLVNGFCAECVSLLLNQMSCCLGIQLLGIQGASQKATNANSGNHYHNLCTFWINIEENWKTQTQSSDNKQWDLHSSLLWSLHTWNNQTLWNHWYLAPLSTNIKNRKPTLIKNRWLIPCTMQIKIREQCIGHTSADHAHDLRRRNVNEKLDCVCECEASKSVWRGEWKILPHCQRPWTWGPWCNRSSAMAMAETLK